MTADGEGFRVVLKSDGGLVLGVRRKKGKEPGYDLPGGTAPSGKRPKEVAPGRVLKDTGLEVFNLIPAHRGPGDERGTTSAYVAEWAGSPRAGRGLEVEWVRVQDILLGKWGLFARDVFNRLGMLKRPSLNPDSLYRISSKALGDPSSRSRMAITTEGVDLVLDEISFLMDLGKASAVDDLLGRLDVPKVHADILDALISATDGIPGLTNKQRFDEDARAVIEAVDGRIPKWKLIVDGRKVSDDVRGDARKIYREKAEFFKQRLKEKGNLDEFYAGKRTQS